MARLCTSCEARSPTASSPEARSASADRTEQPSATCGFGWWPACQSSAFMPDAPPPQRSRPDTSRSAGAMRILPAGVADADAATLFNAAQTHRDALVSEYSRSPGGYGTDGYARRFGVEAAPHRQVLDNGIAGPVGLPTRKAGLGCQGQPVAEADSNSGNPKRKLSADLKSMLVCKREAGQTKTGTQETCR